MEILDALHWRYATKRYDSSKKISQEDLGKILEAARLAPTSSGLQPFEIFVVNNPELRKEMLHASWGQPQVVEASHLLVFAAWDNYTAERIDHVFDFTAAERGLPADKFKDYTDRLKAMFLPQTAEHNFSHAARQADIALGFALAAAAELHIDSTPMEGFENEKIDTILNLGEKGLRSVAYLALGHRDVENDWLVSQKKVRKSTEELITIID